MKGKHLLILTILPLLLIAGALFVLLTAQSSIRETAHQWEGERTVRGPYILETFRSDTAETAEISFRVLRAENETLLYTCPESWRTMDLKAIQWTEEGFNIQVVSGDVGTLTYSCYEEEWHREVYETSSPVPIETADKGLPFADMAVARQLGSVLGVEHITEEDRPRLEGLETLRLESGYFEGEIVTLEDLPLYCPNLKRLELNLYGKRPMMEEDWAALKRLPLETLDIYMGMGYECLDFPENLQGLALFVDLDDGEPFPLERLLLAPVDDADGLLKGRLEQYVRLRVDGWVFELLGTDFWNEETEENFWGGWESKVLISKETEKGLRFIQLFDILGRPNADTGKSLVCADVDFDGKTDLLVMLGHFGAQGAVGYTAFLQREGKFIPCESFSDIPNPSLDPENKQVLCQMRHSAASHGWGKYQYRNGDFVQVAYLTEEPCPESWGQEEENLIWQWTEETIQGGEMVQSRCWRSDEYTREELEDIIYNENSDWGLLTDRWRVLYNSGLMVDFSIYGE